MARSIGAVLFFFNFSSFITIFIQLFYVIQVYRTVKITFHIFWGIFDRFFIKFCKKMPE